MKTALVLLQLGMGAEPKKFYKGMLSDKRVKKQTIPWKILLHCFILPKLTKRETSASPIIGYTEELTKKLQARLSEVEVCYALNYYNIDSVIDALDAEKIILQPLFPQYSSAVVGSALEKALGQISKKTFIPEVVVADLFYDNSEYIKALTERIKANTDTPQAVVLSYHSITLSHLGDPYEMQCDVMTAAIKKELVQDQAWQNVVIKHGYQSKFGRGKWLGPSIIDVVKELSSSGIEKIAVVPAGFLMDCSETLVEINKDLRGLFYQLGGKDFQYVTCFNADDVLVQIIERSLKRYL